MADARPDDTVTLAQLSDIHLGPLPPIPWRLLNAKRAAGALNWYRKRRHLHRPAVAAAIASDAAVLGADHIAVTGDVTNLGLSAEIERGAVWLGQLGPPTIVSVIPGNHDIYSTVHGKHRGTAALEPWAPYFASCAAGRAYAGSAAFPFVRIITRGRTRVALIGLNSAVETAPMIATGELGAQQRLALGGILAAAKRDGLLRVIMLHHPPLPGLSSPHHELTDAAALQSLLKIHGAELVIHGHNHRAMFHAAMGPDGTIPVVGVPSASAAYARGPENMARMHVFQIRRSGDAGRAAAITLIARGLAEPGGPVVELERRVVS